MKKLTTELDDDIYEFLQPRSQDRGVGPTINDLLIRYRFIVRFSKPNLVGAEWDFLQMIFDGSKLNYFTHLALEGFVTSQPTSKLRSRVLNKIRAMTIVERIALCDHLEVILGD